MIMPKNSSTSEESISPSGEFMRIRRRRWVVLVFVLFIATVAAYFLLRPKSLKMTEVIPAGPMVYLRVEHILDHMKSLRDSKFWAGLSQMNLADLLGHEGVAEDRVSQYVHWREHVHDVIANPLFKQVFGREAAVVIYPPQQGFSNGNWPEELSGVLLVARPENKTRVAETLAGAWNRVSREWESAQVRYKNTSIISVKFKNVPTTVFYVRFNDLIFFSFDDRLLRIVIDVFKTRSGTLVQENAYSATAGHFHASSHGDLFVDVPKVKDFVAAHLKTWARPQTGDDKRDLEAKIMQLMSFSDGIYAGGGSFVADKPLRMKWLMLFDPAKSADRLKRLNECARVENPLIDMVPKDVIIYQWMGCLDFQSEYAQLNAAQARVIGKSSSMENPLLNLQKTWGLSIEKDILPVLGGEMGWYMYGIEEGSFFPIPKIVLFMKVKDAARAEEILKKIVTTPVTLLQNEDYAGVRINFVTVPLVQTFRPSYAFIKDYLMIATSDKLVKQSLDVSQNPSQRLVSSDVFKKSGINPSAMNQAMSFMNVGEIARQCKVLSGWADEWFARKIDQADADALKISQKLRAMTETIQGQREEYLSLEQRLNTARQEKVSLEAQVKAAAVVLESQNTLSQQGQLKDPSGTDDVHPEKLLEFKRSQVAAMELESENLRKEIETMTASQPDLMDDLKDYEVQKSDAQKYRYYINQVVGPLMLGLESLSAQAVTTNVKDGVLESEIFLSAQ